VKYRWAYPHTSEYLLRELKIVFYKSHWLLMLSQYTYRQMQGTLPGAYLHQHRVLAKRKC
jgi:hypothetical protein